MGAVRFVPSATPDSENIRKNAVLGTAIAFNGFLKEESPEDRSKRHELDDVAWCDRFAMFLEHDEPLRFGQC